MAIQIEEDPSLSLRMKQGRSYVSGDYKSPTVLSTRYKRAQVCVCNYMHLHVYPLRIHIPAIRQEINEDGNLHMADTLKFTNEQIDKFIAF